MKDPQLSRRKRLAVAIVAAGFTQLNAGWVSAAENMLKLEEIIVTAQKSDDRIQDIPSTINLVSADTLENLEINKFADIAQVTAGLTLDVLTGRRQSINMRGVQTNPDGGFGDGVAVYWNDMVVRTDVAFQQLFDIDRVEVLRGPQGTLQGATSPAGAIHIRTKMPYLDAFRANISQTLSDNNGTNTEFGMDIPIVADMLAMRVAGVYDDAEVTGVKNITTGQQPTTMSRAGRVSFAFQPGDVFSARLAYEYLEREFDGGEIVAGNSQDGRPVLTASDRKILASINNYNNNRNNLASLNMVWDFDRNQITWETGYYNSSQDSLRDADPGNRAAALVNTKNLIPVEAERLVQELRLNTQVMDFWDSLVGLYYQKDDSHARAILAPNAAGTTQTINDIPSHGETYAVFTHQKFEIAEDGLLEVGLRYQKVNQFNANDLQRLTIATGAITTLLRQISHADSRDADAEVVTGSLKFSWTFTPDLMAYASYDQGFRPGGFTPTSRAGLPVDELAYDEEKSEGIELGVKSSWFDNRVRFNADVFYQEFKDGLYRSQALLVNTDGVVGVDPPPAQTARLVYNADSIIQGAEVEMEGLLTQNWRLGGNVTYVDAKYDNANIPTNSPTPSTQTEIVYHKVTSGRIGSEPNWSATAQSYYTLPLGPVDAYFNVLVKYQSDREDDSFGSDFRGHVGGYTTTNLYIGVRDADEVWDVTLWAKNLFDKDAEVAPPEVDASTSYLLVRPNEPRTIGVTAKYNFGKS